MIPRLHRRAIPLLGALLLIASQFAVTLHACNLAAAPMEASGAAMEMGDCMKQMDGMQLASLCKMHCEQDAQSDKTAFPDLPPPSVVLILIGVLSLFLAAPLFARSNLALGALISSSPPLRLQYQTFRN